MEIDPLYCDVIVARFEKFAGKQAEVAPGRVELGRTVEVR